MSDRQQDAELREELRLEPERLLEEVANSDLDLDAEYATITTPQEWRIPRNPSDRITDRIYCGGDDYLFDHNENANLVALGITHVLDCRAEADTDHYWHGLSRELIDARKRPFVYLCNGTQDDFTPKSVAYFKRSIDFGLAALADPNAKIYAHCAAGINRGPSSCYAILRATGYSRTEAERLLRENRPGVRIAYLEDAERALRALGYV